MIYKLLILWKKRITSEKFGIFKCDILIMVI